MHRHSKSYLVYGVQDIYGRMLNDISLERLFPDMDVHASYVSVDGMEQVVYGYRVEISAETDKVMINDETKKKVKELYDILCEYHTKNESKHLPEIGYYCVVFARCGISGDMGFYSLS